MREIMSILMCGLLTVPPAMAEKSSQAEKIRARVVVMPAAAIVEVTDQGGRWKGRLGEVGAEGFEVQVAGKDRLEQRTFRYVEVSNVRVLKPGMNMAAKITVGVLAGIGVWVVVVLIFYAAHGWDS
jgi:hypothetical protein